MCSCFGREKRQNHPTAGLALPFSVGLAGNDEDGIDHSFPAPATGQGYASQTFVQREWLIPCFNQSITAKKKFTSLTIESLFYLV
jgi:hypothetical protein